MYNFVTCVIRFGPNKLCETISDLLILLLRARMCSFLATFPRYQPSEERDGDTRYGDPSYEDAKVLPELILGIEYDGANSIRNVVCMQDLVGSAQRLDEDLQKGIAWPY